MISPGDHIMYMGRCAIVQHVYDMTANIKFIRSARTMSRQLDVYLSEIVIPGPGHVCV